MSTATFAHDRRAARPGALFGVALGLVALGAGLVPPAFAQQVATPPAAAQAPLGADELQQLIGPIALYPDDLVGIVLPASTYPLQVVEAARFLDARGKDPSLKPDPDWDDSVVALLNYPDVLHMMNDDLDWTWRLGEAVLNQRGDVLDAVQQFRNQAYAAGNLRSDGKQTVKKDDEGAIAIAPANPEVVYVPYYEPSEVLVYQPAPVFYYYPIGYPLYYYPYPVNYAFDTGFFWGVTTAFVIGWHTHHLIIEHCGFAGHPYYGRHYYEPFYVRNDIHVSFVDVHRGGEVWQPRPRDHGRPFAVSDERRVGNPYAGSRHERGTYRPYDRGSERPYERGTARPYERGTVRPYDRNDALASGGRQAQPREDRRVDSGSRFSGVHQDSRVNRGAPSRSTTAPAFSGTRQRDAQLNSDTGSSGAPLRYQQRPSTPQRSTEDARRAAQSDRRFDPRNATAPRSTAGDARQYRVPTAPQRSSSSAFAAPRTSGGFGGGARAAREASPPPVFARPPAAVPQQAERSFSRPTYVAPPGRSESFTARPSAPAWSGRAAAPQRFERAAPQSGRDGGSRGGGGSRREAGRHER